MEYNKPISEIRPGDEVEGFYILKSAFPKTTAAGKPYLSAAVADRSGSVEIKVWDYAGPVGGSQADLGRVVRLRAQASEYRGSLQLTVSNLRMATASDKYDASALVPVAPLDVESAMAELRALVASLSDADYRGVAEAMLERHGDSFAVIPAAKSVHHSFRSGLLMHTLNMLRAADFLSGLYEGVIDRSLLLTGTLLHDMAKDAEFSFSALGMAVDYSVRGELIGHPVMGAMELAELARELGTPQEKALLLEHMLLSHHGEPEFGAAVPPMCAEAELLSCIDRIDSRMEIYAEALPEVPEGGFSQRIFALDRKIYRHGT